MTRKFAALLGCTMLVSMAGVALADAAPAAVRDPLKSFSAPPQVSRPIARTWFPDAGAGASAEQLALVAKHVRDLAAAGFGGMEVAFLSDNTNYSNDDARTIGFGTQNWRNIVTQLLTTANSIPGGFGVSFTLSPHWPITLDSIDPNDAGQQHEFVTAYRKITAADLNGAAELPLPAQRTTDIAGGFGGRGSRQTSFLFTRNLVGASVARVAAIDAKGKPVFELASLTDITAHAGRRVATADEVAAGNFHLEHGVKYAGSAAGVPDRAAARKLGVDYNKLLAQWGPEPSDANFKGKIDADGNRRRMADWQYDYTADLSGVAGLKSASAGDRLAVGDYVLIGVYAQGTGQVQSGGASITQYARSYVVDVYGINGVDTIKDFWNSRILTPQIRGLMAQNSRKAADVSIFEDSYEVSHDHPFYTPGIFAIVNKAAAYDAQKMAAVIALDNAAQWDDAAKAASIADDYTMALGRMYRDQHVAGLNAFGATLGYKYRVQVETGLPGLAASDLKAGIQEGDNGALLDTWRELDAARELTGTRLLSEEALTTDGRDYNQNYVPILNVLNDHLALGVNRFVYHGSPFARTFNDYHDAWPGWEFSLGMPPGFGAYQSREVWFQDFGQFNDYIARMSLLDQAGHASTDVAVLLGARGRYTMPSSQSMPALLNAGYSYHVLESAMLELPGMTAAGGVLDAAGPGYRAVVVRGAGTASVAMVKHLIAYAKAGVPVVLLNSTLGELVGTEHGEETAANLARQVAALKALKNVTVAKGDVDTLAQLQQAGVTPVVSYQTDGLQAIARSIDGARYVQLHSFGTGLDAAAKAGDTALRLVSTAGLKAGDRLWIDNGADSEEVTLASVSPAAAESYGSDSVRELRGGPMGFGMRQQARDTTPNVTLSAPLRHAHNGIVITGGFAGTNPGAQTSPVVDSAVTINGSGAPYVLDSWSGKITPLALYSNTPTGVNFSVSLAPHDSEWIMLKNGTAPLHATAVSGGEVAYSNGALVHRATTAGTYQVSLSAGGQKSITVNAVPAAVQLAQDWSLALESWGPDAEANKLDPSASAKTDVNFSNIALAPWSELSADTATLGKLGVASMADVIGIGTYSQSFTLPADWNAGALLSIAHGNDIIAAVTVNGVRFDRINPLTDRVDIGTALHAGSNNITVQIDSPMANRLKGYTKQSYGLTGLTIEPYLQTVLGKVAS